MIYKQEMEQDLYLPHLFYLNLSGWGLHTLCSPPSPPLPLLPSHVLLQLLNVLCWELLLVKFAQVRPLHMVVPLSKKYLIHAVRKGDQKRHQLELVMGPPGVHQQHFHLQHRRHICKVQVQFMNG